MTWETISWVVSLSSAGTTYQGAVRVLVAPRQASNAFVYCFQKPLSRISSALNFQFLSG